jgi:hypothetical protein
MRGAVSWGGWGRGWEIRSSELLGPRNTHHCTLAYPERNTWQCNHHNNQLHTDQTGSLVVQAPRMGPQNTGLGSHMPRLGYLRQEQPK